MYMYASRKSCSRITYGSIIFDYLIIMISHTQGSSMGPMIIRTCLSIVISNYDHFVFYHDNNNNIKFKVQYSQYNKILIQWTM